MCWSISVSISPTACSIRGSAIDDRSRRRTRGRPARRPASATDAGRTPPPAPPQRGDRGRARRSEEHTSELQSHLNLGCRLLLEKNKRAPAFTQPATAYPPSPRPLLYPCH